MGVVSLLSDVQKSAVDPKTPRVGERRRCRRTAVADSARRSPAARVGRDDSALRVDAADAIVEHVGDIQIVICVESETGRLAKRRAGRRAAIARETGSAVSGNDLHHSGCRIDLNYLAVIT